MINGNKTDISIVNVKQQEDINQTDDTSDLLGMSWIVFSHPLP